jgi:hypothetical protein
VIKLGNAILAFIHSNAREHPRMLSAVWFSLAALPLIVMNTFLSLSFFAFQSLPIGTSILLVAQITLPPLIPTALAGMVIGAKILLLASDRTPQAALYGLLTGLGALFLRVFMLGISTQIIRDFPTSTASGDIPGAAIVVACMVVLPGLLMVVMAFGAVAGIVLHILVSNTEPSQEQYMS